MKPRNPFPANPVATHGVPITRTCDELQTVRRARQELLDYLSAYAKDETRYGGAVALAGAHGSGKTHLLLHLADASRKVTTFDVASIYVKSEEKALFNVYRQALVEIGRLGLVHLLDLARRALAKHDVEQTRITESISGRIDAALDLNALIDDGTIDADALENTLDEALHASGIPRDVIQVVKLCATSSGDKAFQWLLGNSAGDLDVLGVPRPLRQIESASPGSSSEDNVAVDGLSLLALLHRIAGSPMVVLIDQLDVLLPHDFGEPVSFPALTTFLEKLTKQSALVFLAGSEAAWKRLPPDVAPRLLMRTPLPVGALTREEIAMLVDALMDKRKKQLSDDALDALDELTGGNPREVLAISHQLFEKTDGRLARATAEDVAESALRSGTVDDKARLALTQTDEVIRDYGRISRNVGLPNRETVDRVVRQKDRVVVAIVLVKASDDLDEAIQARNLRDAIHSIKETLAGAPVIAVTVGYTSAEVRELFKAAAVVIPFDDRRYKPLLEAEMVRIDASTEPVIQRDQEAIAMLQKIAGRLDELESRRRDEADKAQGRFAAEAAKATEPETKERALKTRWQLLEELDRTTNAASSGDSDQERQSIRSILINNEAYRKDRMLDALGGLYLDVTAIEASTSEITTTLVSTKLEILADMRTRLRGGNLIGDAYAHPGRTALIASALSVVAALVLLMAVLGVEPGYVVGFAIYRLPWLLAFGLAIGIYTYGILFFRNPIRLWHSRIKQLRDETFGLVLKPVSRT